MVSSIERFHCIYVYESMYCTYIYIYTVHIYIYIYAHILLYYTEYSLVASAHKVRRGAAELKQSARNLRAEDQP